MKILKFINRTIICTLLILLNTAILSIFPFKLSELPPPELKIVEKEVSVEERTIEEKILENMTVEEKVGQLLLFGFEGTTVNETNRKVLENCNVGGILLLKRNITGEEQLKKLITEIQTLNDIPLFVAIDQEGGVVSRIEWGTTLNISQANIDSSQESYSIAKERGNILKNYGINMNLAPVAEYITNPSSFLYNRVYLGTQEEVAEKSIHAVNGYTDSGILPVLKHFPGHSDTSADSHYSLPVVNVKVDQWNSYIKPFTDVLSKAAVKAIMIGHVQYPNIDNQPSSISKEIISNRLVENLGFQGLVITDDMEMSALSNISTEKEVAKQALLAGNDILIYSRYNNNNPSLREEIYQYLVEEVKNGNIEIDNKVLKILKIKQQFNILIEE